MGTATKSGNISEWFDEHDQPFHLALAYLRAFTAENNVRRITGSDEHELVVGIERLRGEVWDRLYDSTTERERTEAFEHAREYLLDEAASKLNVARAARAS